MKLEEMILKVADRGETGRKVKKAVGFLAGGLEDIAFPFLIPVQNVVEGIGASERAVEFLKRAPSKKTLIVTDDVLLRLGLLDPMTAAMEKEGFPYAIFSGVEPDPSIENVEDAYRMYCAENCDSIVAFGGGSALDAAKVLRCRVAKPQQTVAQMGRAMGYFPVTFSFSGKVPFLIAVPTTAGTGAESTVAAVISNHSTAKKFTITDIAMRPEWVLLDASLAVGLPPYTTALTAIDAVSHCVEGFLSYAHNPRGDEWAIKGVRLVRENVDAAVKDGKNLEARQHLCAAAYAGGQALNMETTGYVHAFSHKIGAKYGLIHGRCIGAVLPILLEDYGDIVEERLAKMSRAVGIAEATDSNRKAAEAFLEWLRDFNQKFGIPPTIPEIKDADMDEIADSIMVEIFIYPNKKVYTREEIKALLRVIRGDFAH